MKQTLNIYKLEAEIFNAIAHPVRLEILELLKDGEACVCHLEAMLGQRQAYISQHLNVLRHSGLVDSRKDGVRVYYQVTDPFIFTVIDLAETYLTNQEKISFADTDPLHPRKPCHCPQCSTALLDKREFGIS